MLVERLLVLGSVANEVMHNLPTVSFGATVETHPSVQLDLPPALTPDLEAWDELDNSAVANLPHERERRCGVVFHDERASGLVESANFADAQHEAGTLAFRPDVGVD